MVIKNGKYTCSLPTKSGTVALTSNISGNRSLQLNEYIYTFNNGNVRFSFSILISDNDFQPSGPGANIDVFLGLMNTIFATKGISEIRFIASGMIPWPQVVSGAQSPVLSALSEIVEAVLIKRNQSNNLLEFYVLTTAMQPGNLSAPRERKVFTVGDPTTNITFGCIQVRTILEPTTY